VPLFIFMAGILERAGIAEAIFRAVHVWAGRLRGGLAVAVIISCALMAAMVGVIGAEIVTMGVVALPAMLEKNYKKDLALGCICAGGGLATLIPPSVVFIMFGLTAGVSIGQLYMAGVIPGLMLAASTSSTSSSAASCSPSWRRPPRPRTWRCRSARSSPCSES
jgi:tripartite ATP-independent transporter DctM subunit